MISVLKKLPIVKETTLVFYRNVLYQTEIAHWIIYVEIFGFKVLFFSWIGTFDLHRAFHA